MPAPLTAQQIALYMSKRRVSSRQEVAAAAAGISVSSAHRIDSGRLQPKAAKPPADADLTRWLRFGSPCWCRYWSAIQL